MDLISQIIKMIQIHGVKGAGKSTLLRKFEKHSEFVIQDEDEISDRNAVKIIESKKNDYMFNAISIREFWSTFNSMRDRDIRKIIDHTKKEKKILILSGLGNFIYPETIAAYHINIDPVTNYTRLMKRTIETVCTNRVEIMKMLKTEKNMYKIILLLCYKFGVRATVPEYPLITENRVYDHRVEAEDARFQVMDASEIYKDIIGLKKTKK